MENNLPTHSEMEKLMDTFFSRPGNSSPYDEGITEFNSSDFIEENNDCKSTVSAPCSATSALDELMAMTGLEKVKQAVRCQLNYHRVMKVRREAGLRTPRRLMHMLLSGDPGTGKTTVARLIARIYKESGLLTTGTFVEVSRATLVGQWIGETEQKVTEKIVEARGGVLFIDEIYNLVEGVEGHATKDFGMKVIDTLMPVLSNPDANITVIGAGYPHNLHVFLKSNPGLASRFTMTLHFPNFDKDELYKIAIDLLDKYDFKLSSEASQTLSWLLDEASTVPDNGNARMVTTLVENHLIPNLCNRIAAEGDINVKNSGIVLPQDFPALNTLLPNMQKRRTVGF